LPATSGPPDPCSTSHPTHPSSCPPAASSTRARPTPPAGASPTRSTPTASSPPARQRTYVSSESEDITYSALVNPDGTLTNLKPFAQRGGESVAVDTQGNVYIANGQIFVFNPAGRQIAQIDVPERPIDLIFGGPTHRTLFILTHHALFAATIRGAK
jgi:hypothetical protein